MASANTACLRMGADAAPAPSPESMSVDNYYTFPARIYQCLWQPLANFAGKRYNAME